MKVMGFCCSACHDSVKIHQMHVPLKEDTHFSYCSHRKHLEGRGIHYREEETAPKYDVDIKTLVFSETLAEQQAYLGPQQFKSANTGIGKFSLYERCQPHNGQPIDDLHLNAVYRPRGVDLQRLERELPRPGQLKNHYLIDYLNRGFEREEITEMCANRQIVIEECDARALDNCF